MLQNYNYFPINLHRESITIITTTAYDSSHARKNIRIYLCNRRIDCFIGSYAFLSRNMLIAWNKER